jgi:hypothetical protein
MVLRVIANAFGFGLLIAFAFVLVWLLASFVEEARADGVEWITGSVDGESINILRHTAGDATWSTGTVGDDTVNLLENRATDEASRTTGTIGDSTVDLFRFGWDDPPTDGGPED